MNNKAMKMKLLILLCMAALPAMSVRAADHAENPAAKRGSAEAVASGRPEQRRAKTAKFDLYGADAVRTTVDLGDVNRAISQTSFKLARFVVNANGSRSYPSLGQASRYWTAGPTPDEHKNKLSRCETSFDDADGRHVKIEVIAVTGEPTLIFVTYDKPDGPLMVLNELRASLKAEGYSLD